MPIKQLPTTLTCLNVAFMGCELHEDEATTNNGSCSLANLHGQIAYHPATENTTKAHVH